MTGPLAALLDRWRAKAARVRRDGLAYPLASYEDGVAKGASRAIEGCVREIEDLVGVGQDAEETRP